MWEKIKERGFDLVGIGVLCANLTTFVIIIVYGIYQIWEPWKWLLYLETVMDLAFIAWGVERLIADMREGE